VNDCCYKAAATFQRIIMSVLLLNKELKIHIIHQNYFSSVDIFVLCMHVV